MRDWMKFVSKHSTLNKIGSGVAFETLKRQYEDKIL